MTDQVETQIYLGRGRIKRYSKPVSATLFRLKSKVDLLTGEVESSFDGAGVLDRWADKKLFHSDSKKVIHLFYELGFLIENVNSAQLHDDDPMLAIEIEYSHSENFKLPRKKSSLKYTPVKEPDYGVYQASFESGYESLMKGDCYQFNLTYPFTFKVDGDVTFPDLSRCLFGVRENIGAYAHITHIPILKKAFLSNSPECLFQARQEKEQVRLWTMPIKGTIPALKKEMLPFQWRVLKNSSKDQAELFMITDLLRNDLTRIEMTPSRVVSEKLPLVVPGLLHQYSLIEVLLSKGTTLKSIIKGLFPGGSITGAPKKRVMGILDELEEEPRGFYCGSTIVMDDEIVAASVNIRSGEFDFNSKQLKIHAGGGITLESDCREEFEEMLAKKNSFLSLFTKV